MFKTSSQTICVIGEYLGIMRPGPTNLLELRTHSGDVSMMYPFSHEVYLRGAHSETVYGWADGRITSDVITVSGGSDFLSVQYDGVNIWTLEDTDMGPSGNFPYGEPGPERVIRRWRIEDFMCTLKDSWVIRGRNGETIDSNAFAVECYYNRIGDICGKDAASFGKLENTDLLVLEYPRAAFFQIMDQAHVKSALYSYKQDVPILEVLDSNTIRVATPLEYTFFPGDFVYLRRDIYLFNNESLDYGSDRAALYHFDIPHINAEDPLKLNEPLFKKACSSSVYANVQAATFLTISGNTAINNGDYVGVIGYLRGTQLLLNRPNLPAKETTYPGDYNGTYNEFIHSIASLHIDHLDTYEFGFPTYDINYVHEITTSINPHTGLSTNLFTLQPDATYFKHTYKRSNGAFMCGNVLVVQTLNPVVRSLAIHSVPVIAEEGGSPVLIYVTVRDQFGNPLNFRKVTIWIGAYIFNGSINIYSGLPEYNPSEPRLAGYFVCPESVSECYQGSFTWLGDPPHVSAEIISGSQSSYPGGPPNREGWVVVEWRPGTIGSLIPIEASVQP